MLCFKQFLENTISWSTNFQNPQWYGTFSVGDQTFTVTVMFDNVIEDGDLAYQLQTQSHLNKRKLRRSEEPLEIAKIYFEDNQGRVLSTGEVGSKVYAVDTAMREVFLDLWEQRKPAFILFETKSLTKIMAYDRMVLSDPILKSNYIPLKMNSDFRTINLLDPDKSYSTWILQRKDIGEPFERFQPIDRSSQEYKAMRAIRRARNALPGEEVTSTT